MRFPTQLKEEDKIGICAPSSGVSDVFCLRLDHAINQLNEFNFVETKSVRNNQKLVSADKETRAREFMSLYFNDEIKAIIPPWGGELLMDLLPYLDYQKIINSTPKWVCGFSDTSTLLFVLTVKCDIASVHSPNLLDFGLTPMEPANYFLIDILKSNGQYTQKSLPKYQKEWNDVTKNPYVPYNLTEESKWKSLKGEEVSFKGRLIGGCMDTICKLFGTPYAPISEYISKYKENGIIWYLEFLEMDTTDIYRTLLQMMYSDYFKYTTGILISRNEIVTVDDFSYMDAIGILNELNIPVIYDVDFGHLPPQLSFVNGAICEIKYNHGQGEVTQWFNREEL